MRTINQLCLVTTDGAKRRRTRHLHVRYHFIKERIKLGEIVLIYCPTDEMVADLLTKQIPKKVFQKLRNILLNIVLRKVN